MNRPVANKICLQKQLSLFLKNRVFFAAAMQPVYKKRKLSFVNSGTVMRYLLRCYSFVGRQGGRQAVSLGLNCETPSIVKHELMHALGFYHEHSRPDRDDHVIIQSSNIETGEDFLMFVLFLMPVICTVLVRYSCSNCTTADVMPCTQGRVSS